MLVLEHDAIVYHGILIEFFWFLLGLECSHDSYQIYNKVKS